MSQRIAILGATSAIAVAAAQEWAKEGAELLLIGRDSQNLNRITEDLKVRGAAVVESEIYDFKQAEQHAAVVERCFAAGKLDVVLVAYGVLPEPQRVEGDVEYALSTIEINFNSVVSLIMRMVPNFKEQQDGVIAVISSVAGDRGRKSNFVYGSAKGGLQRFLEGLRNCLFDSGVAVVDIRPGFVETPMTESFKKGALWVKPDVIGKGICKAVAVRREKVYLPWFWRFIMIIIRHIPEKIFKRMSL